MNPDLILNAGDQPVLDWIDRLGNLEFIDDQRLNFAEMHPGFPQTRYCGVYFDPL